MHPTSKFHWTDRDELLEFVGARAFATIVAALDGRYAVAQAPLLIDEDRVLLHLSRANPIAKAMPLRVVAIVDGPDAYVSPDWYASEPTGEQVPGVRQGANSLHGALGRPEQVPTWNYVAVEIEGKLASTDDAMLRTILERTSAEFERRIPDKRPWTIDKLTPGAFAAMSRGIVGATLSLDSLRGTRKLSQNKPDAARAGVRDALAASSDEIARALGRLIR